MLIERRRIRRERAVCVRMLIQLMLRLISTILGNGRVWRVQGVEVGMREWISEDELFVWVG
jgi:hypothetical protein